MSEYDFTSLIAQMPNIHDSYPLPEGGQKAVYRAEHTKYGRVAVKFILKPDSDLRVLREVETAKTHFTHIPEVYETDTIEYNGVQTIYLIEQYIDGVTLRKRLGNGPLSVLEVMSMLGTLLTAVVGLEEKRIVHRDIKPENIIMGSDGKIWLLDLGIARHLDKESLTATTSYFGPGSIGYSAPEQFRNQKAILDSRADLFSIGVVTYEALSGKNPFLDGARDALEVIYRMEHTRPGLLELSEDTEGQLSGFINALIDKSPSWRPQTAKLAYSLFQGITPTITMSH